MKDSYHEKQRTQSLTIKAFSLLIIIYHRIYIYLEIPREHFYTNIPTSMTDLMSLMNSGITQLRLNRDGHARFITDSVKNTMKVYVYYFFYKHNHFRQLLCLFCI